MHPVTSFNISDRVMSKQYIRNTFQSKCGRILYKESV